MSEIGGSLSEGHLPSEVTLKTAATEYNVHDTFRYG